MIRRLFFYTLFFGAGLGLGVWLMWRTADEITHTASHEVLLDGAFFAHHRTQIVSFIHDSIKQQCLYLYNTPDFIAKMTPYYKHKASCITLIDCFFADTVRCNNALRSIGNCAAHTEYINKVLACAAQALQKNPRLKAEDALNDAMCTHSYCQLQDGVYDDAYFESTALSLTIIAIQKLNLYASRIQGAHLLVPKRKNGRSKWRWHSSSRA